MLVEPTPHEADSTGEQYASEAHVQTEDGEGKPSRRNTLRALRVLQWFA